MTNVTIDMNNMLFRSMHVLGGFGKKQYTFDNAAETDELMRKLAMDMSFLIRMINPSRVIFAVDGKSWRKGIQIEENEGYKGQRKLQTHINWDNVFDTMTKFLEIVEDHGMIVTKIDTAEADDVIAMWHHELLINQKQHCIAITGDEDIRQVVKSYVNDKGKPIFSCVFNPFMQGKNAARKLYVVPKYFNKWLEEADVADIWDMSGSIDVDKADFKRIKETDKVRIEETDGTEIANRKIFCGDDGDNIPAIYTWIAKEKNGEAKIDKRTGEPKVVRITPAPYEKITESIRNAPNEQLDYYDFMERKDKIFQGIQKAAKHKPTIDIEKRLKRQIKLVVLDQELFPPQIVEDFNEHKVEQLKRPRPEIGSMNMNSMLQGTRYVKKKAGGTGTGTESGIFKQIDNLTQNKKLF